MISRTAFGAQTPAGMPHPDAPKTYVPDKVAGEHVRSSSADAAPHATTRAAAMANRWPRPVCLLVIRLTIRQVDAEPAHPCLILRVMVSLRGSGWRPTAACGR